MGDVMSIYIHINPKVLFNLEMIFIKTKATDFCKAPSEGQFFVFCVYCMQKKWLCYTFLMYQTIN